MNKRKMLIDLLDNFPVQMEWHDNAELANYLISNDVTIPVRCKDCERWRGPWLEGQTMGKCMAGKTMITEPDHFCSYGKRRSDGI